MIMMTNTVAAKVGDSVSLTSEASEFYFDSEMGPICEVTDCRRGQYRVAPVTATENGASVDLSRAVWVFTDEIGRKYY